MLNRKNALFQKFDKREDEIKDSDSEEEKNNKEDEEDKIDDDFLDLEFDCETEIMRAKKNALQRKVSKI